MSASWRRVAGTAEMISAFPIKIVVKLELSFFSQSAISLLIVRRQSGTFCEALKVGNGSLETKFREEKKNSRSEVASIHSL